MTTIMNPLQRCVAELYAAQEGIPVESIADVSITNWETWTQTFGEGVSLLNETVHDIDFEYVLAGETAMRGGSVSAKQGSEQRPWQELQQALMATVNLPAT